MYCGVWIVLKAKPLDKLITNAFDFCRWISDFALIYIKFSLSGK